MSAAWYVGRVGGLAVALGVGTAILTGTGIAAADSDTDATSSNTATSEAADESGPATGPAVASAAVVPDGSGASDHDPAPRSDNAPEPAKVSASGGANTQVRDAAESSGSDRDAKADDTKADDARADDTKAEVKAVEADTVATIVPKARKAAAVQADAPTAATGYAPDFSLQDGVITGDVAEAPPSYYKVVKAPENGGKVTFDASGDGDFTFLPDASQLNADGADRFTVMVAQKSALVQFLEQIPTLKPFVEPIVVGLHRIPIVGFVLSPVIGTARTYDIGVDVGRFTGGDPIAFTTMISSFDGTKISVNYFPKVGLVTGDTAPTILNGPSLATAGYTDPNQATTVFGLVPGLSILRENYNVVTWDPRGEFASGGRLHLDSELFEAKDVSEIVSWVAQQATTKNESEGDPLVGMVGGSYGGGIQLTSAGIDDRIDAISPGIAWNNLVDTLYPNDAFKTSWASLLLLSLVVSGSRLDPQIYAGITTGVLIGRLFEAQQAFLSNNSPDTVTSEITIPTLFLQGTVDTLFPLQQAMTNAEQIGVNGAPMKMIWYCGGHGKCLDPVDLDQQTTYTTGEIMSWMDTYVLNKGTTPPVDDQTFSWVDQDGNWWYSGNLPTKAAFYGDRYQVPGSTSGLLPIVPVLGGSGPQSLAGFPVSLVSGAKVEHGALNLTVPNASDSVTTYVVGRPQVTVTYAGLGTSRNVYAQLVDEETGRVLGNIVSSIPVKLDGVERTVTVDMEAIAYTMQPGDRLTLQIFDSATSFENFTSYGLVNVTSVSLSLPTAANADGLEMDD
jgi:ABC-2 type transport system ATP-binding protein